MSVKVSVIVPVYNVEQYLEQCLDSVLSQTLREIEIIAINDGSPDGSLQILQRRAAQDARIRIIDKQNEGVGKARNDGLRAARGDFIAFLDADDYYPNETVLETLYASAKKNAVSVAGGRRVCLLESGSLRKDAAVIEEYGMQFASDGLTAYADFQYDYGYWQYIYARDLLRSNQIEFPAYKRFQDPPFFVRAMQAAGSFYAADCESYCYRQVASPQKTSIERTMDFLDGVTDNLMFSRAHGLAKLHRLTAMRLDREGSYMAIRNLYDPAHARMIGKYLLALRAVDLDWLEANGMPLPSPFVPEVFEYAISTAEKYEKLRSCRPAKAVRKLIGK